MHPNGTIPVSARVVAPVEIAPRTVMLPRRTQQGTVYDIICTARSWRSSPFTLVAPSELPPGLEARLLSRDSAGSVQKIQICVSPELRKTGIRETLEFTATVDGRELRVPVTVLVLPPRFEP